MYNVIVIQCNVSQVAFLFIVYKSKQKIVFGVRVASKVFHICVKQSISFENYTKSFDSLILADIAQFLLVATRTHQRLDNKNYAFQYALDTIQHTFIHSFHSIDMYVSNEQHYK